MVEAGPGKTKGYSESGPSKGRFMKGKIIFITLLFLTSSVLLRPPVDGGAVTSGFGRRDAFDRSFHTGTDIALPIGTPVNSTSWGTVTRTGFCERGGNYIIISHLPVLESRYLHLDSILVRSGQAVTPLCIIGAVGNTGLSTGSHLHFEIRVFGTPLPPYLLSFPGRLLQRIGGYRVVDPLILSFENIRNR